MCMKCALTNATSLKLAFHTVTCPTLCFEMLKQMRLQGSNGTKLQKYGKQGHPNIVAIRGSMLHATSPQICVVDDKLDFVVSVNLL